jgi:hypothetical protein
MCFLANYVHSIRANFQGRFGTTNKVTLLFLGVLSAFVATVLVKATR